MKENLQYVKSSLITLIIILNYNTVSHLPSLNFSKTKSNLGFSVGKAFLHSKEEIEIENETEQT